MQEIKSENPKEHWWMVNCKGKSILDLGCAYNDVDEEKTRENKLGTPHYFIAQEPSAYLGVDSFAPDIEQLKTEFPQARFICDSIDSPEKIRGYIIDSKPQIIKCDIEGAEMFFLGLSKLSFVEELCIELHGPHIEKPFLEWANGLGFFLKERAILAKHRHISVAHLIK
jgi:hypothetical protein